MAIVRFETDGPPDAGLQKMKLDPSDFQSDLPEQHIHLYYEDPVSGISAGVWTTTDMQEAFGPYPGDEFMLVLEGRALMTDVTGKAIAVETGQSFIVRNAIPISWKQVGFLRKFFVLYRKPNQPTAKIASADGGVMVLDPHSLASELVLSDESIGGGIQRETVVFTNDDGKRLEGAML